MRWHSGRGVAKVHKDLNKGLQAPCRRKAEKGLWKVTQRGGPGTTHWHRSLTAFTAAYHRDEGLQVTAQLHSYLF